MCKIDAKGLILRIFTPTIALSLSYLLLGYFCSILHIPLFCILGTVILVPMELAVILSASKKENGVYSLKSAFAGQEKLPLWKILIYAFVLFGIAGLLSIIVINSVSQWFITWLAGMIPYATFSAISYLHCCFNFSTSLPVQKFDNRQSDIGNCNDHVTCNFYPKETNVELQSNFRSPVYSP